MFLGANRCGFRKIAQNGLGPKGREFESSSAAVRFVDGASILNNRRGILGDELVDKPVSYACLKVAALFAESLSRSRIVAKSGGRRPADA